MKKYYLLLIVFLSLLSEKINAQFVNITHLNGTQVVGGISVTVTPNGGGATNYPYWCQGGPYWIGSGNLFGSYTYDFATPVMGVRFECTAMDQGEIVSFEINGVPYTLNTSNLSVYTNTCNSSTGIIQAGSLFMNVQVANGGGGRIDISDCAGINSVTIVEQNNPMNGTTYSAFYTMQVSGGSATVTAGANGPLCEGQTLNLTATNGGSSYSWTGPNNFTSNNQNPSLSNITAAGSGDYIVTMNGPCGPAMDTVTVVISPNPVITSISNNSPICQGQTLNLTTGAIPGATYSWTGPNSFSSSSQNPSIPSATPAASGTYNLTVAINNCVSAPSSTTATVIPTPPPPAVTDVVYCQFDPPAVLTALGTSLLWYTSISGSGSPSAPTPNTSSPGLTTYYVTQTQNGCESPKAPLNVSVKPKPLPPVYTGPVHYCRDDASAPLTALGQNIQWYDQPTGGSPLATAPTVNTSIPGDYSWYVSQIDNGCESDRATVNIHVADIPPAPVTADITYCQFAEPVALTAIGQDLKWYNTDIGGTALINAPVPATNVPESRTWYVSQTIDGCESPRAPLTVTTIFLPTADFMASRPLVCQADTLQFFYTGNATLSETYLWTIPAGTTLVSGDLNSQGPIVLQFDSLGYYPITLNVDNQGCNTTFTYNAKVVVIPQVAISMPQDACVHDTVKVGLGSYNSGIAVYTWDFAGGTNVLGNINEGPYKVRWDDPGQFTVAVNVSNTACATSAFDTIRVHALPDAHFSAANGADICLGDSLRLTALDNKPQYSYQWEPERFFDYSNNYAPVVNAMVMAAQDVTLTVTSPYGCTDKQSMFLDAKECCVVSLPNAFSPNGDGKNDIFRPITAGMHSLTTFLIVDRWGKKVFETNNENEGWNGTLGGEDQDVGTYHFYLKYKCNGKDSEQKGDFMLIR